MNIVDHVSNSFIIVGGDLFILRCLAILNGPIVMLQAPMFNMYAVIVVFLSFFLGSLLQLLESHWPF